MPEIISPDDPRLASYRDLRADKDRRFDTTFICEGHLCVSRAIESGWRVRSLLSTEAQLQRLPACDAEKFIATPALLQEVTGFKFHRGVLACVDKPVLRAPEFSPRTKTVLFAEEVSNPSNLGALMRNARSLGADLLVVSRATDPFSRRAVRTAMCALFSLPLAQTDDLAKAFDDFRDKTKGEVVAATLGARAKPLREYRRPSHLSIVMGSEGEGLPPETIAACDAELTIEMSPGADSLNVAAASAILLYALVAKERF